MASENVNIKVNVATKSLVKGIGLTNLLGKAVNGLKALWSNVLDVMNKYHKANSRLASVLRKTTDEIALLKIQSQKLGSATKFTAAEVANLQTEYAKLGFSQKQILNMTESTLDLAAASDTALDRTAQIVGSTIKGFGLLSKDTKKVADIMAKSFSTSALDMENFAESMKLVAPVAKATNISVEETTALLGELHNSGLKGSIAGVALKNVLGKLTSETSKLSKAVGFSVKNDEDLAKALETLKNKNLSYNDAVELTDKRSAAAFLTMVNGEKNIKNLKEAFNDADGAARKMADTMQDNLSGDITKLSSAWEGFINRLTRSSGMFDTTLRSLTQWFTKLIDSTKGENDEVIQLTKSYQKQKTKINGLVFELTRQNTSEKRKKEIYDKLNKIAPKVVENLSRENINTKKLKDNLKTYNKELLNTLILQIERAKIQKLTNDLAKAEINKMEAIPGVLKSFNKDIDNLRRKGKDADADAIQSLIDNGASIEVIYERIQKSYENMTETRYAGNRAIKVQINAISSTNKELKKYYINSNKAVEVTKKINKELLLQKKLQEKFGKILEDNNNNNNNNNNNDDEGGIGKLKKSHKELKDAMEDVLDVPTFDSLFGAANENLGDENEIMKKGLEETEKMLSEFFDNISNIPNNFDNNDLNFFDKLFHLSDEDKERLKKDLEDFAFELSYTVLDNKQQQIQNELDLESYKLNKQKEAELKNKNLTEKQKQIIEEKYKKKQDALNKKAFEKQKQNDIARTIINTAKGIMNVWATAGNPYVAAVESAFVAGLGAMEIKQIQQQKYVPTYAKGGILDGKPHSQGGINTPYGQLEGDEIILTKNVTASPVLKSIASDINVAAGGAPFAPQSQLIDYDLLASKINDKKVIVTEFDVTKAQQNNINVAQMASF